MSSAWSGAARPGMDFAGAPGAPGGGHPCSRPPRTPSTCAAARGSAALEARRDPFGSPRDGAGAAGQLLTDACAGGRSRLSPARGTTQRLPLSAATAQAEPPHPLRAGAAPTQLGHPADALGRPPARSCPAQLSAPENCGGGAGRRDTCGLRVALWEL